MISAPEQEAVEVDVPDNLMPLYKVKAPTLVKRTTPVILAVYTEETTTQVEVSIEEPIIVEEVVPETPVETPSVDGLQPHVGAYKDLVGSMFGITNFSTFRPGDPGDHGNGLAIDFMVYSNEQLGDTIAEYTLE